MNIEIFLSVLAALVAYRVLSALIDAVNPLAFLTKPKMMSATSMSASSMSGKRMAVEDPPKVPF